MSQLMETLFSLLEAPQQSNAEAEAVKAAEPAVLAAQQRLTDQEFDRLWDALMDIGDANLVNSFTLGFRLGVQLTLEGLRPING